MKNIRNLLCLSLPLLVALATQGQLSSAYYQAVTNLNPIVYLPLQETTQPPANDVEPNLGSLGAVANAVYSSTRVLKGFTPSATGDGDAAAMFQSGLDGSFLAVPTTDSRYSVAAPFSVEAWVYATNYSGFVGIVSQTGGNPGGLNGGGVQGGWCLSAQYITYFDTSSNFRGFDFHVYNGQSPASGNGGPRGGAEVAVPYSYALNTWYHLVATFDGANCKLYVNGVDMTPTASFLLPLPAGTSYVRDTWDPILIGASRNLNGNRYGGAIDEVAIYTNALTLTQVQNHYNAAPGSAYQSTVMTDQPLMYWRMDAPAYTAPAMTSYPTASYYSANNLALNVGAGTLSTPVYGTATTPGTPGPQFAGLLDPGLGSHSYAVAINGIGGGNGGTANVNIGGSGSGVSIAEAIPVDVGYNAALNPTAPPFSVSAWFKGNPADENGGQRFQAIFGHTDNGWRSAIDTAGKVHFKPGNNGTEITSARVYNDGQWHHLVATCSTTTENLYIDGVLDTSTGSATSFAGSINDVLIGGDPQYLNAGNGTYASSPSSSGTYAQRNFAGSVAHFAFFNYELSPGNVSTLYAAAAAPPVILSQPFGPRTNGYAYNAGGSTYMFFGVTASGSAPLGYQWYRTNNSGLLKLADDGVKYASSTTAQVTVSNLVDSDSGTYFVVVTNAYGSVTSSIGTTAGLVQIYQEPFILGQTPGGGTQQYVAGQTPPTYSVSVAAATNSLSYQWYTNGTAIPGATSTSLPLPPVQVANSGTVVLFIANNSFGSATSAPITLSVTAGPAAPTNSYAQAVLALSPSGYWPMHEIEPPLTQRNIETNYGSLGHLADAYYCDWQLIALGLTNIMRHQQPGALANDSNPCVYFTGQVSPANFPSSGSGLVIPRTSPLTTIKAPFTLEAWVKPADDASFQHILSVGSQVANSGLNSGANEAGFDWLYSGTADTFSITMRNGNGTGQNEPKTSASYPPGVWYHLVTTFDGTNVMYYINGNSDNPTPATATMAPNTWMPLTIAGGRWSGTMNNPFRGSIDELAVYTNVLSQPDIQAHYNAGLAGPAGTYEADVLADHPLLYYHFDSPTYTQPPVSTWPALVNYGSAGVQGVYRPNAVPSGVPGPSTPSGIAGLGLPNTALASDGMSIFADAGYDSSFNPTGGNAPFSVGAWFKLNPADIQQRNWQTLVGHTDQGWRCAVNGGTGAVGFDSGNGLDVRSTATYNDGNWHQVVGTYDGSNTLVYVDGALAGSGLRTTANAIQTAYNVYLASSPNGQSNAFGGRTLAGNMCEAAVWNAAWLTATQVATLYNAAGLPPYIITQPVSASANQNSSFTNTVVAGGAGPLAYRWYRDNQPLPVGGQNNLPNGATNATLIINPVQVSDQSSNYYVVITNNYGSVTSVVWSLNPVYSLPVFEVQPFQVTHTNRIFLFTGAHPTFKALASGAQPLFYQWFTNGVAATGNTTTGTNYTLLPLQTPNGVTNIYCVASNFVGKATNTVIAITAFPAPALHYPANVLAAGPVGYWRLNEAEQGGGDNGVIANDYWGANNGVYTNVVLGQAGYGPCLDPATTAPQFDQASVNSMAYGIGGIDFSATNASVAFTVSAWVNGVAQTGDAAIVGKGYGGGGEEFCIDVHSSVFRFFVRNAAGTAPNATSAISPDSAWHHLVGVCDEPHGFIALYVDGLLRARTAIAAGSGINALGATNLMTIGSRPNTADPTVNELEFNGLINDVAIYNYALNGAQIAALYLSAGVPPLITQDVPGSTNVNENGTLAITAAATGTAPLSYQWYDNTTSSALPNQTNATLLIPNYPSGMNGEQFYLTVTDPCGSNSTSIVSVNVQQGTPQFVVDLPAHVTAMAGSTYTYAPVVAGTEPFTYQWYNGTTPIGGQTGPTYTLAVASGNYSVVVTGSSVSVTSVVSALTVVSPLSTPYANTLLSLGPVAYWPLNETAQPPVADIETNLGSLGPAGNAYYVSSPQIAKAQPGALAGDADTAISLNGANGSWLGVPRLDPRLTLSNSFTVECWVKPNDTSFAALISQATPIGAQTVGYRGDPNVNGWALYQNGGAPGNFSFHLYNGVTGGGPEPKEFAIYSTTDWQHVAAVFDGTYVTLYVNGLQSVTSVPLSSVNPAVYAPNYWCPVQIGASGINHNVLNGSIDEVAIYATALAPARIEAHYEAGTNSAVPDYKAVVMSDNPYLYWRMDSPTYTAPSTDSYPLAVNYGSMGAALDGVYQPGTVPGAAGPPSVSFGNNFSVAVNGLNSCVVIPYHSVLDPIAYTPFSVSAWFKGNPADGAGRWENILGHSDRSWVFHLNNTVPDFDVGFNGGNTDVSISTNLVNANDGNWHFFAGTYDGATYTVYVDAFSASAIATATGIPGTNLDILIGGDPEFIEFGDNGGFNERYLPGSVAQVAFFTNALSAAQVAQLYTTGTNKIPTISIARSSGNIVITYAGTLVSAPSVLGPYSPVDGASSPYVAPHGQAEFYRSRYP